MRKIIRVAFGMRIKGWQKGLCTPGPFDQSGLVVEKELFERISDERRQNVPYRKAMLQTR